jgi:hypothetical protein
VSLTVGWAGMASGLVWDMKSTFVLEALKADIRWCQGGGAKGGIQFRTAHGFSKNHGKSWGSRIASKYGGFDVGLEVLPSTLKIWIPAILGRTLGNARTKRLGKC